MCSSSGDADKLDNCRVKLEEPVEVLLGCTAEEVGTAGYFGGSLGGMSGPYIRTSGEAEDKDGLLGVLCGVFF